jgi:hypothetical protein
MTPTRLAFVADSRPARVTHWWVLLGMLSENGLGCWRHRRRGVFVIDRGMNQETLVCPCGEAELRVRELQAGGCFSGACNIERHARELPRLSLYRTYQDCGGGRFWDLSCESTGGIARILVFES